MDLGKVLHFVKYRIQNENLKCPHSDHEIAKHETVSLKRSTPFGDFIQN